MPTPLAVRPASATRTVPVAVSTAVAPLLRAPADGTVLGRFPTAVYVQLDVGGVLALVAGDGVRLPNALLVAAPSRTAPFAGCGRRARVVGGALVLDGVTYRPVRTWTPRERTTGPVRGAAVAELAHLLQAAPAPHDGEVGRRLQTGTARLAHALRHSGELTAAVDGLLGLGPGLTPAGDDVLAGALVTCAQCGRPLDRLTVAPGATTALSADLLAHAAAGRAGPPVLAVLDALVGARPVAPALAALLAVGSSSGHDTATGVLAAAQVLLERA